MTLETFTIQTFEDRIGERFTVTIEGAEGASPVGMALEQVREVPPGGWRPGEEERRKPFALQLLGPVEFVLPQRIYRFQHDSLGTFDMFIVPVGRTSAGVSYEAVFS